jgi:hypothetical protein
MEINLQLYLLLLLLQLQVLVVSAVLLHIHPSIDHPSEQQPTIPVELEIVREEPRLMLDRPTREIQNARGVDFFTNGFAMKYT